MDDPVAALQARCELGLATLCARAPLSETEQETYRIGFIAGATWGMEVVRKVYTEEAC